MSDYDNEWAGLGYDRAPRVRGFHDAHETEIDWNGKRVNARDTVVRESEHYEAVDGAR